MKENFEIVDYLFGQIRDYVCLFDATFGDKVVRTLMSVLNSCFKSPADRTAYLSARGWDKIVEKEKENRKCY